MKKHVFAIVAAVSAFLLAGWDAVAAKDMMLTEIPIIINDNTVGSAKNIKVRFDYVLCSSSTQKPIQQKTLEFLMSEYSDGKYSLSAPAGMYIDRDIHLQVRCYTKSWRNHEMGMLRMTPNVNRIYLSFSGNLAAGRNLTVSQSSPELINKSMTTEAWIATQNDLILGGGKSSVHHIVKKDGPVAEAKPAGSTANKPEQSATRRKTVFKNTAGANRDNASQAGKPAYDNASFDPRFSFETITERNMSFVTNPPEKCAPSELCDVETLVISQFQKEEASETEVTVETDAYDPETGKWVAHHIVTRTFYSGLDRMRLVYNSSNMLYHKPVVTIRTHPRGADYWVDICKQAAFDLATVDKQGIRAAKILLNGDITTHGRVVILKVDSVPNCIYPIDGNYVSAGPASPGMSALVEQNHSTLTGRTGNHSKAPAKLDSNEDISYASQLLLYIRDITPKKAEVKVTLFVDFYDAGSLKWKSHEIYTASFRDKSPGYTFFLSNKDELIYSKPYIKIETRPNNQSEWKEVKNSQFKLDYASDVVILAFSIDNLHPNIVVPAGNPGDLVVPL